MGAVLAGVILLLFGVLLALGGGGLLAAGSVSPVEAFAQAGLDYTLTPELLDAWRQLTPIGAAVLIIGVLHVLAGLLVLLHKRTGRWLGILFGLAGTVLGGLALFAVVQAADGLRLSDGAQVQVDLVNLVWILPFMVLYLLVLLALLSGGSYFRRERFE